MDNFIPLMRREWLQHRFAWAMLVLVPLALAVLMLGVGNIQLDDDVLSRAPRDLALMVGTISMMIATATVFLLLTVTSLFIAIGTPRRDDADRSHEFWLSMPSGHAESLAAPLVVHLLLVPAAALLLGLLCALPVSLLTVGRVAGLGEWAALPWGTLATAMGALAVRLIAGLPLALAWVAPLVLLALLANAAFKRWGLPVLAVGVAVSSWLAEVVFGVRWPTQALAAMAQNGALALAGASGEAALVGEANNAVGAITAVPAWAARDFGAALAQLGSVGFVATLAASALLFAALVEWRRRRGAA